MKKFFYFLLAPIFLSLHFILAYTYGSTDQAKPGWYQSLWDGDFGEKVLFIILTIIFAPIFIPIILFMRIFYPMWEDLA